MFDTSLTRVILDLQTKDIKFNIDSRAPGFGHYVSARIVIGHEGELLTDKLVLNYTHEIYMNDEINGGLYGGEECEKESGVSCYVSISDAVSSTLRFFIISYQSLFVGQDNLSTCFQIPALLYQRCIKYKCNLYS
jgi:hypothetical protein